MHRNTWSLPVIDYLSVEFDVPSLEDSAIELETRKKGFFYIIAKVGHLFEQEPYKVHKIQLYCIYGCPPLYLLCSQSIRKYFKCERCHIKYVT